MLQHLFNLFATFRRRSRWHGGLWVLLLSAVGSAACAVAVAAAASSAPPSRATITLRDRDCTLPGAVHSGAVRFDVVNRGAHVHTFAIRGHRLVVRSGKARVLLVAFPHAGSYAYTCSRSDGLPVKHGRLRAVGSSTVAPTAARPCGSTDSPPAVYKHVVWIVLENKSYRDVVGAPNAPNINKISRECGLAANFYAEAHPSLPNYVAMTSGDTQGITDDAGPSSHPLPVDNIFQQVGDWRALEESMPSNCSLSDHSFYAVRHNPAVYYTGLASSCTTRDVPLGSAPDISARFTFVTPDTCHDMHSSSCASDSKHEVSQGDAWLGAFLTAVFTTPQYRSGTTAVFVTWDEGYSGSGASGQHIPTLVIAPSVRPGTVSTKRFDHYAMLRTTEELLGVKALLGAAAQAPTMRTAFGF